MLRLISLACALALAACDGNYAVTDTGPETPVRIVSLDYCADQYVLKFVSPDRILAVSPDAGREFSYMRDKAQAVNSVRPRVENVLELQPDLIVRSYGGGAGAEAMYERAGIPVLNIGYANNLNEIASVTRTVAHRLGVPDRGEAVIADFENRLGAIAANETAPQTLYMTPSGVTSGPGTLIHDMLLAAGLANYQTRPGWRSLPLEELVYAPPELIAAAFFDTQPHKTGAWSSMRHPVATTQLQQRPVVSLNGAWTSCGAWFLIDAIEALAQGDRS